MLAGAHRILGIVTRRQGAAEPAATIGKLPNMRRRRAWARSVYRLLEAVSRCYPSWRCMARQRRPPRLGEEVYS